MFRTELPLTPHPQQLPLSAQVLTVGSCFSDTIGSRLAAAKVKTLVNPFGTVFNPLSACQLLRAAAGEDMDWQQHLVEARGRWQSYDLHASIGADSPVTLLQRIQGLVQEVGEFLQRTDVVMLTLGSAYAYRLLETDEVVNNCHKVPAEKFEKVLLTPDEIINAVAETHAYLRRANPKLRFILTVSPVRHLKDTLPLNSVSKSVLRVACHYLSELLPDVSYFPAYELLLDDLRDYRFYAADMLHPSDVAENYIWERFTRTYFDPAFGRFRKEWEAVRQALGHRPLYPEAPEHREFLEATLARLHRLAGQTDVRAEIRELEQQLAALPLPKPELLPEPELEEDDDEERIDIGEPETPLTHAVAEVVPVAAPVVDTASEVAIEQPESEDDDEEEASGEESLDLALESEVPQFPKKKRRSRGGAKRTARKKAAQLYAQQAAEAAAAASVSATAAVEPAEAEQLAPAETLSPAAPTSAEPNVADESTPEPVAPEPTPEPTPAEAPAPVAVPVVAKPQPAPNVDWLQPMDEPEEEEAPKRRGLKGRSKGSLATEKKPRDTKDRVITTPPTKSRRKPAPLYAEQAAPVVESIPVEAAVPESAPVEQPAPAAVPEPAAETVVSVETAPVEAVVPELTEATETAEKPKPARKPRPSRAKAAVAPVEPTPALKQPRPKQLPQRQRPGNPKRLRQYQSRRLKNLRQKLRRSAAAHPGKNPQRPTKRHLLRKPKPGLNSRVLSFHPSSISMSSSQPAHTNRLSQETSPYLLQHAHNPVDWYPWGEEALSRARAEQKPIIVSIGYAACHWCHVMERESFENPALAQLMNEHFVCIKVDREERPDVDQVYMDALQAMGVPGGWPLNVFLNPEAKPFYGGTYFPPVAGVNCCRVSGRLTRENTGLS
ncbi:GSCFA domain-containing protein [Hymenobacter cellulosilyticus]|uniref:GSCFA domain-containing protein n=1 Tax=Hymenobacter cellulosilyticus TaxID=2932248 RepID=UPI0028803098|nr:GSCFA domain-containing protein [Hymenobacter cellulosilyticus]